jgi:hypothetical protein
MWQIPDDYQCLFWNNDESFDDSITKKGTMTPQKANLNRAVSGSCCMPAVYCAGRLDDFGGLAYSPVDVGVINMPSGKTVWRT